MKKNTFHLISLGCAKNTVDSNTIATILTESGILFEMNPKQAEFLIVNTCGFIQPAREEAIETLRNLASIKKNRQKLLAVGCMAERFSDLIFENCPEVDGVLGTRSIFNILQLVSSFRQSQNTYAQPAPLNTALPQIAPEGYSAYVKIADGCSRRCAFCSIPLIKGDWNSRTEIEILRDVQTLVRQGIQEIILVAQDTTAYGLDRGEKDALPSLLEVILKETPELNWLRILYAFPGIVSDRLIDLMADEPKLLPYLDIPLQHAHPNMLKRMNRPSDVDWVRETIAKMRKKMPSIAIRSTFIAGFPNETEQEFLTLSNFLDEMRFDRVGVFPYYFEPGTSSAQWGDTIPLEVKQERVNYLMKKQQKISHDINRGYVGKTLDVLIEQISENGLLIGRSYRDAPEIDGQVIIEGDVDSSLLGKILPVKIHGALEYDLTGRLL